MGQPNPPADPGATPPATPPAPPAAPPADPPKDPAADAMSTDAGKKALDELRKSNKDMEKQLKELRERDPVAELLKKLGATPAAPGTDPAKALQDRISAIEERERKAELRDMKVDVATKKGLTPAQAKRLQGSTREELEADADDLIASFPAPQGGQTGQPGTPPAAGSPAPDPTQGARGGGPRPRPSLGAAIDAAMKPK